MDHGEEQREQRAAACGALGHIPGQLQCMTPARWMVRAGALEVRCCDEHMAPVVESFGATAKVTAIAGRPPQQLTASRALENAGVPVSTDRLQIHITPIASRVAMLARQRDLAEEALAWLTPRRATAVAKLLERGVTAREAIAYFWQESHGDVWPIQDGYTSDDRVADLLDCPVILWSERPEAEQAEKAEGCDAWRGPCSCGDWHREGVKEYLDYYGPEVGWLAECRRKQDAALIEIFERVARDGTGAHRTEA